MGSQEIISGNLQVLKNSLINRSWQSRWCVLYDGNGARLEYFDNQEGMNRQSAHKKVVILEKISRIEKMQPKQSSFPFDVTVKSGKLSFMARGASECESWIQAFTHIMNQEMGLTSPPVALASANPSSTGLVDNILYESTELVTKFPVTLVESESKAAKDKDLVGKHYLLAVGRLGYDLYEVTGQSSLHHWPFRYVRKFGATEEHFILLGGSRCEEWSGEYKFLTSEGHAIKSAVDKMTKLLAPMAPSASQNEGPPPVKEKPVPLQPMRVSTSEVGGATSKLETLPSSRVRDTTRAPPTAGGIFPGPAAEYLAELDDKLYEFTKVRPDLEIRHPKHQDKLQGKVSAQPVAPTPGSVASAAPSNQNKAPLQPTNSQPSVEINEQKLQSLSRAHSADYDKAQKKKAKEDKKREEKERKEQEKREKEQQERERKEQEKREKEEKRKKSREKSKSKSSTMSKATAMMAQVNVNTYEEVDVPSPPQVKQAQENEYTEANFRPQPPANQAASRGHIYSEPDPALPSASVAPAKSPEAVYSQVMKHRSEAWREFGRAEDNQHEEDYDQIKQAAKEADQTMVPSVTPIADDDETYDLLTLPSVHKNRPPSKTNSEMDNVYGVASATPALSTKLPSAADSESGYEDAEMVNAAATAFQRNNYNPSHNYEDPDFGSMENPEEDEKDPYANVKIADQIQAGSLK